MDGNTFLIEELARKQTDAAMDAVIAAARRGLSAAEVHQLAGAMAESGEVLGLPENLLTGDLASTGGPSSLSTLLAPLYLRAYGLTVPKLGVPGRPAGGVDVLAQIPGYRVSLSIAEAVEIIQRGGYAHFSANETIAPLDAALFRYRQKVKAQNLPALASASLLAKKIACRLRFVGLDARVGPHGNFGSHFGEAKSSAELFCAAAAFAGIQATVFLTDARIPYQPYIGRGEALLAVRLILKGGADPWLSEHDDRCRLMAAHIAALATSGSALPQKLDIGGAFATNVDAQGGSMAAFFDATAAIEAAPRRDIIADREGFLRVDLASLRDVFEVANETNAADENFPDEIGAILRTKPGTYVSRGDVVASIRASDRVREQLGEAMTNCFHFLDLLDYAPGIEEVVRA